MENSRSDHYVHELRSLIDLPRTSVLYQVLVIDLTESSVGKLQVTIVIDVGINRLEDGLLVGDVDYDAIKDTAGAITILFLNILASSNP